MRKTKADIDIIEKQFEFLSRDFGFETLSRLSDAYKCRLVLKTQTTGVVITFDRREFYPFVQICRLVNGEFQFISGEMTPKTVIHCFDLDDLLTIRSPNSKIHPHSRATKFDEHSFESLIAQQADNLRSHAQDVLGGDFSSFPLLDQIVKARAKQAAFQKWGKKAAAFGW